MKLWEKGIPTLDVVNAFTVGDDLIYDQKLIKYDIQGSIAHAQMLGDTGIVTKEEAKRMVQGLEEILREVDENFTIPTAFEDVHSYVEYTLIEEIGEVGKKLHTARSRNDQVLTDLCLYFKDELSDISDQTGQLAQAFLNQAEKYKDVALPGYTHLQVAMPSSFGMWFAAYAELLADDLQFVKAAQKVVDQNPLGSAAGYGSSFPIDRETTTKALGFEKLRVSAVSSQLSRGKMELQLSYALSSVAQTLSAFSVDVIQYMCQNFGFIRLPEAWTTGSSIMPHKKNPDVFELVRAKCNQVQGATAQIAMVINNLSSGYHRDYQVLKEMIFPAIDKLKACLDVLSRVVLELEVVGYDAEDLKYRYLHTVDAMNSAVMEGVPFRDAYRQTADAIANDSYQSVSHKHTHIGSKDNLRLDLIAEKL